MSKRILFVDFARSVAIILAILDHSLNDFNIWNYDKQIYIVLKTITISATPTFLFLFGMMLEIVYLKKLKSHGLKKVSSKLILRSFQCYIGYVITALAGYIAGVIEIERAISAILFLNNAHFGNILKLYTILLLLAIPLLWIRLNKGLITVIVICFSYWILYPLFSYIPLIHPNIDVFTSYAFGFGGNSGPSILHSLSIVSVGMIVANFILKNNSKKFYTYSIYLLVGLIIIITIIVTTVIHPTEYLQNLISNVFRKNNNPLYYLTGVSYALIITLISSLLVPIHSKGKKIQHLLVFGRSSLLAFTLANVLLNFGVKHFELYTWTIISPIVFIVIIFICLKLYEDYIENITYYKFIDDIFTKLTNIFNRFYVNKFSNWIVKKLNTNKNHNKHVI